MSFTPPSRIEQHQLNYQQLQEDASNMADIQSPRQTRSMTSSSSESEEPEGQSYTLRDLGPDGYMSQTAISMESFVLGNILGAGLLSSSYFIYTQSNLWRPPLFLCILAIFHFTEFYTYARWNLKNTKASSFLTLSNGRPYIMAMSFAFFETLFTSLFLPQWQSKWAQPWLQVIGLAVLIAGQYVRHASIATAGTSFNHIVQKKKKDDHVLITWGLYRWFRHPSYFGFYWWALGGQLLLGNAISTPIFALVLWQFFYHRIPSKSAIDTEGPCTPTSCRSRFLLKMGSERLANKNPREMMWAR